MKVNGLEYASRCALETCERTDVAPPTALRNFDGTTRYVFFCDMHTKALVAAKPRPLRAVTARQPR